MSYRGRQHGQRAYTGKGFDNRNDERFFAFPPVRIEEYDPATDLACEALKIPYGQVFVGGEPDHVRSHEVHTDNKDRSAFIDCDVLKGERRVRREDKEWSESRNGSIEEEQKARLTQLAKDGYRAIVCWGWIAAWEEILWYLGREDLLLPKNHVTTKIVKAFPEEPFWQRKRPTVRAVR